MDSSLDTEQTIKNARRKTRLKWYEEQIENRLKSLAAIFVELKNDKLEPWLATHESFEAYCEEVWGLTPRRRRQIERGEHIKLLAAEAAPDIADQIKAMPEGQVRLISTLPEPKRVEVIRKAIEIKPSGKPITTRTIKMAKARIIEPGTPECCPTCKRPL